MSEQLREAVRILKEVAKELKLLKNEAELAFATKDFGEYTEKLRERAQLLVDLPDRLTQVLEGAEGAVKQEILWQTLLFASEAREALEAEGTFLLGVLLTHQGQKKGEKNDLEELIEFLVIEFLEQTDSTPTNQAPCGGFHRGFLFSR